MEQEINLADYQINIADIRQHIDEVAVDKTRKQPQNAEEFTADTKALYADFAKEKMGIEFKDISLFITALTHRSYVNEHKFFDIFILDHVDCILEAKPFDAIHPFFFCRALRSIK